MYHGMAYLMSGYSIVTRMLKILKEKTPFFISENYRRFMENVIFAGDVRVAAGIRIQDIGGYNCCGRQMRFWCDDLSKYVKVPITFENYNMSVEEGWNLMQKWIDTDTCEAISSQYQSLLPVILIWTKYYGNNFTVAQRLPSCPYQCIYTNDQNFRDHANAVVFHIRDLNVQHLPEPQLDSYKVFFNMESPPHTHLHFNELPSDYFNLSMTYRVDSDVYCPYGSMNSITIKTKENNVFTDEEVDSLISKKRLPILYLVSNCKSRSGREWYAEKLKNFINITQLGKCNNKSCDQNCEHEQIEQHYFYLAFENSICNDYVTEKFWRLKKLIIPIVLNRKIAENVVPGQYFIAVDDFKSVESLAEHLNFLMENPSKYKKYLSWYKNYEKHGEESDGQYESCFCRLCERVSTKLPNRIQNIEEWWEKKGECKIDYAKNLDKTS
uniref:Fucosyltransferase n=1 Tax=Acrobeloides nanus TaxID=290746 RepID=A0A914E239_9BILA